MAYGRRSFDEFKSVAKQAPLGHPVNLYYVCKYVSIHINI